MSDDSISWQEYKIIEEESKKFPAFLAKHKSGPFYTDDELKNVLWEFVEKEMEDEKVKGLRYAGTSIPIYLSDLITSKQAGLYFSTFKLALTESKMFDIQNGYIHYIPEGNRRKVPH